MVASSGQSEVLKNLVGNFQNVFNENEDALEIEKDFQVELKSSAGVTEILLHLAHCKRDEFSTEFQSVPSHTWVTTRTAIERGYSKDLVDALSQAQSLIENRLYQQKPIRTNRRNSSGNSLFRIEKQFERLSVQQNHEGFGRRSRKYDTGHPRRKPSYSHSYPQQFHSPYKSGSETDYSFRHGISSPDNYVSLPHSPSSSQTSNPLYKTRLCQRFETEGFCPYDSRCTFAHGIAELRAAPDADALPKNGPQNPLWKTRLCDKWMEEGFCQFGPNCAFAHGEHELRLRPPSSTTSSERGSIVTSPISPISSSVKDVPDVIQEQEIPERSTVSTLKKKMVDRIDSGWSSTILKDEPEISEQTQKVIDSVVSLVQSSAIQSSKLNVRSLYDSIVELVSNYNEALLIDILVAALFCDKVEGNVATKFSKYDQLLKEFVKTDASQIQFLAAWETHITYRSPSLLPQTPIIYKTIYDQELVSAQNYLTWYDPDAYSEDHLSDVKKRVKPLIEWLRLLED